MGARSSSSADNITTNTDARVANDGGVAVSNSNIDLGGGSINITSADPAIVDRALTSVDRTVDRSLTSVDRAVTSAFDFGGAALATAGAATANAIASNTATTKAALGFADSQIGRALATVDTTLGDGFQRLLDISDGMFKQGDALINRTQETVADAYADAQNTAKGTIDNRTMIILGVVAAAVVIVPLVMQRKG